MENRTLGSLISRREGSSNMQEAQDNNFTAFLTLFSINLVHRFPTDQIDNIDVSTVENVARLSALCTPIVLDTWSQYSQSIQQGRGQRKAA